MSNSSATAPWPSPPPSTQTCSKHGVLQHDGKNSLSGQVVRFGAFRALGGGPNPPPPGSVLMNVAPPLRAVHAGQTPGPTPQQRALPSTAGINKREGLWRIISNA